MPYAPYSNYGYSPQGTQLAQGFNTAAANTKLFRNETLTPQEVAATQQGYEQANQLAVSENTPQARSDVLAGTNFGAAQQNYSDLAQKLAAYDNIVLKPEFAGQSPGMPSDLPVNPDVYMGNVSYLTPESAKLPANQGIYNANPAFALQAQGDQQSNILNLLNTLNEVIGKELGRGKDIYASRLKTAMSTLQGLSDILQMNAEAEGRKLDRESRERIATLDRATSRGEKADREFDSAIVDGMSQLQLGEEWGPVFNRIKAKYPHRANEEIRTALGPQWEQPGEYERFRAKQERTKTTGANAKMETMKKIGVNVISELDSIPDDVKNKTGSASALGVSAKLDTPFIGPTLIRGKSEQDLADLESRYFALVQSALTSIQGTRPSDYDVKSYQRKLGPSILNTPEVNRNRINNLINLMGIEGELYSNEGTSNRIRVRNKQTGQTGTLSEQYFDPNKYERI